MQPGQAWRRHGRHPRSLLQTARVCRECFTLTRCWLLLAMLYVITGTSWHSMIQTKHISLNTLLVRQTIDWTVQWSMHQLNPQTVHRCCECAACMTPCIATIDAMCVQSHDMLHINEWWCSTSMQHPCNIHATYMANEAQWVMTCWLQKSKLITSSALLHMWEKDDSIYHHQPCHIHGQSTTSFSFNMCLPIIIIVDEWIMISPNTFPRSSMQHQCYIHATSNESMLNAWLPEWMNAWINQMHISLQMHLWIESMDLPSLI